MTLTIVYHLCHSAVNKYIGFRCSHQHELSIAVKGVFSSIEGYKMGLAKHSSWIMIIKVI